MPEGVDPYAAPLRIDTAMFIVVDPCQLTQSPSELATLVEEGKAALVSVQMDGTYSVVLDEEAVGLVIDVDPEASYLYRPSEAREALGILNQ